MGREHRRLEPPRRGVLQSGHGGKHDGERATASRRTRPALAKLISASPNDGELFSLRALEAEQQLDFAAAEADWIRVRPATDKAAGQIALADYYHRQAQTGKELAALHAAAITPAFESERLRPATEQTAWKTFERAISLVDDHLLGYDAARTEFQSWVEKYPAEPAVYSRFVDYAVAHKQFGDAEQTAKQYSTAFPGDTIFPVRAQAQIEAARGSTQAALALYDRSFRALWPPELVKSYFDLLGKTGSLRRYLQDARRALESNTGGVNAAARIFYYWQQQGNLASAQHALMEYESRKQTAKSAWTADELVTLATLYESANNPDRAARCYYALYSLPAGTPAGAERALAGLTNLLFVSAGTEHPVRLIGSRVLSRHRPGRSIPGLSERRTIPDSELDRTPVEILRREPAGAALLSSRAGIRTGRALR